MTSSSSWSPHDVRRVAAEISPQATWVRVDDDAIIRWARFVPSELLRPNEPPAALIPAGSVEEVARWTLFIDALNFCFWTEDEPWTVDYAGRRWHRYAALVASLARGVAADRRWLEPGFWATVPDAQVETLFAGRGRIPLADRRAALLRETGCVLLEHHDGRMERFMEASEYDAASIVVSACRLFPGFRDVHGYRGRTVPILKRAQILAADLAMNLGRIGGPAVNRLEALTAFADYRIPQMLRHLGILRVHPLLAARIEDQQPLEPSSEEEVELRAVSIHAVECMVEALRRERGLHVPAWIVDEYLWAHAHDADVDVAHHRCLTTFY